MKNTSLEVQFNLPLKLSFKIFLLFCTFFFFTTLMKQSIFNTTIYSIFSLTYTSRKVLHVNTICSTKYVSHAHTCTRHRLSTTQSTTQHLSHVPALISSTLQGIFPLKNQAFYFLTLAGTMKRPRCMSQTFLKLLETTYNIYILNYFTIRKLIFATEMCLQKCLDYYFVMKYQVCTGTLNFT